MNIHDTELPPLPTTGGIQEAMKLGPDFIGSLMQSYARAALDAYIESKELAYAAIQRTKERK